jgi:toxin ParE1/3/4
MRHVAVHMDASAEAEEAALWYEAEREGLGQDFVSQLQKAYADLREGLLPGIPWRGALASRGVKFLLLNRFPFKVVFVAREDAVLVLAIAHHSRKPAYWRERLKAK